jgi:hypothetical protein
LTSQIFAVLPTFRWRRNSSSVTDLYDDGIRWLKQIITAAQPYLRIEQVNQELDRRKAIKRRGEEAGLFRLYVEDGVIEEI